MMDSAEEDPGIVWRRRNDESTSGADDDCTNIWDDSALIEAYDKAVSSFKNEVEFESQNKFENESSKKGKGKNRNKTKSKTEKENGDASKNGRPEKRWKVGDKCLAMYYEDGLLYGATITGLNRKAQTCTVLFDYYKNEADVDFKDLFTNTNMESQSDSHHSDGTSTSSPNSRTFRKEKPNRPLEFVSGWRIGDPCLVPEKDGTFRKGIITAFPTQATCEVTYFHRGGRRTVDLSVLHSFHIGAGAVGMEETMRYPFSLPAHFPPATNSPNFAEFQACMMMPHHDAGNPFSNPVQELHAERTRMPPPPPPPPPFMSMDDVPGDEDALSSMLMSWYMVGYHTGFYQGMQRKKVMKTGKIANDEESPAVSCASQESKSPKNR